MTAGFPPRIYLSLDPGDTQFRVDHDFTYITKDGDYLVIPKEFKTDLASIPKIFRNIISKVEKHMPAAIIHDYLYVKGYKDKLYADQIFLEAMERLGVGKLKRKIMYRAVRIGGRGNYE